MTIYSDTPTLLWRRIVDFPLIAMLVAAGLTIGVLAGLSFLFAQFDGWLADGVDELVRALVTIGALLALYKLVLRHLGEASRDDLPFPGALRELGLGVSGGFAIMTVTVALAALFGVYRITGWGGWSDFGMILVQAGLVASFVEELLFRGILFRWIEQLGGSWLALAITSALFGLSHAANDNATVFSSVAIAIEAGILLGAAYMLTRSLWLPIGLHFGWNVTQGLVWDVPVSGIQVDGMVTAKLSGNPYLSGGEFGLEASVFALVVATGAGLVLLFLALGRGHRERNWWTRRRLARGNFGRIVG